MQHTFDIWVKPDIFVSHEQNILQTGVVDTVSGGWAVELKLKLTIWQQGQSKPTAGVVYADVWTLDTTDERGAMWSKRRFYVILGEYNFPWVHIVFTPLTSGGGVSMYINGKSARPDKYAPVASEDIRPSRTFAVGRSFFGAVDELKIYTAAMLKRDAIASPCSNKYNAEFILYFPFNECKGATFAGYNHGAAMCALLDGSYGDVALASGDAKAASVWSNDSPAPTFDCVVDSDLCANVTQVVDDVTDDDIADTIQPSADGTVVVFPWTNSEFYATLSLCLAAVLLVVFFVRTVRSPATEDVATKC
jgi:hypothetical protein